MVRRLPDPQEIAVAVEHLDAGRHVDDVELVGIVDGDRARFLKPAVGDADPPPDIFQAAVVDAALAAADGAGREQKPNRTATKLSPRDERLDAIVVRRWRRRSQWTSWCHSGGQNES